MRDLSELLLHEFDHGGNADTVGRLLAQGANPNQQYDDGCSVLYVAAECGYTAVAGLLIEAGADIDLRWNGAAPIHIASQEGNADVIRLLVRHGADVNAIGPSGSSPLWLAAGYPEAHKASQACEALIIAGADVNQPHPMKGFTPLCFAAEIGNYEIAELLLSAGADVNYCATDGVYYYSPLAFAIGRTKDSRTYSSDLAPGVRTAMIGLLTGKGAQFEEAGYPTGGRLAKWERVDVARCDGWTTISAKRLLEAARTSGLDDIPEVLESIAAMNCEVSG